MVLLGSMVLKTSTILLLLIAVALACSAQTTTVTPITPYGCVHIYNCITYGPAEAWSLWNYAPQASNPAGFAIFNQYSWVNGFSTVDTFYCHGFTSYVAPATVQLNVPAQIQASCSGTDANGIPFTMVYTIEYYAFYSRGGGGKGGGGAGTRFQVTGGSISVTQ